MDSAFGKGKWTACAVDLPDKRPPPAAIGVAVSVDREWTSIAAASNGEKAHLGAVQRARGTAWVVEEVARIQAEHGCAVVIDTGGPAANLVDPIEAVGAAVTRVNMADYKDACAQLFDAVNEGRVEHANYDDLNAAVGAARKRDLGDRWAWGRRLGDVSMLEAVTLAHYAAAPT
jgi:hypothetical protein